MAPNSHGANGQLTVAHSASLLQLMGRRVSPTTNTCHKKWGNVMVEQHHLTGSTIFGASSHGELETMAIIIDAINATHTRPHR